MVVRFYKRERSKRGQKIVFRYMNFIKNEYNFLTRAESATLRLITK